MAEKLYFISHPEVEIDPHKDITQWHLSDVGRQRTTALSQQEWVLNADAIFSSNELKARETAEILANGKVIQQLRELGEIDRSATGFLPINDFNEAVENFFRFPTISYKGWEKAIDAQKRILSVVTQIIGSTTKENSVLIVSHGGVGALLLSYLMEKEISREEDQTSQGHYFCFDGNLQLINRWNKF